jgi:hypothetical protein
MRTHELKTWPEPFQAVRDFRKHCEVRVDDRGFAVGDRLVPREWDPGKIASTTLTTSGLTVERGAYTDRTVTVEVTHIVPGGRFGIAADHCVMSIVVREVVN